MNLKLYKKFNIYVESTFEKAQMKRFRSQQKCLDTNDVTEEICKNF